MWLSVPKGSCFVLSLGTVILYTISFGLSIGFENIFHFFSVLYLETEKPLKIKGFSQKEYSELILFLP
jgi:hypothetical protein